MSENLPSEDATRPQHPAPPWLRDALVYLRSRISDLSHQDDLTEVIRHYVTRIPEQIEMAHKITKFLQESDPSEKHPNDEGKESRVLAFAKAENANGLRTVFGYAVVGLVGGLEQAIRGFAARIISHKSPWVDRVILRKLNISAFDAYDGTPLARIIHEPGGLFG